MSQPKVAILTSQSLRHQYFVNQCSQQLNVKFLITQAKKNYYNKQKEESGLVRAHFESLAKYERKYFNDARPADCEHKEVEDINDPGLVKDLVEAGVEYICLFGTGILKGDWLKFFDNKIINLHLGLSPFYRGSGTLFWPFYHDELSCLGTTVHLAVAKVDAGNILMRIKPELSVGDNYYDITNKLIRKSINEFPAVVEKYYTNQLSPNAQEECEVKLCFKKDFTDVKLEKVLKSYGVGLTEAQMKEASESLLCACESI